MLALLEEKRSFNGLKEMREIAGSEELQAPAWLTHAAYEFFLGEGCELTEALDAPGFQDFAFE